MSETNSWERFFDQHAPVYDENVFTGNTLREVDFLLEELAVAPGASILDVGCGTGRHSIELARRGYAVTGLDLSEQMLLRAEQAAGSAGVKVNWVRSDAARFEFSEKFDGAICICEGAFGLLSHGDDPIEQPLSILRNISKSLKPGARAIFTMLSGVASIRRQSEGAVSSGRFDPVALVESSEFPPREGLPPLPVRERSFIATELVLMCRIAGLRVLSAWGGTAGNWGRRPLELDEMELMIVAGREGDSPAGH